MLVVRVHYDFASTLCYVAERVMARLADDLARLDVELAWSPFDLARLLGWSRGGPVSAERSRHAEQVAGELGVRVSAPAVWRDSRPALAAALWIERHAPARGPAWRERVWTAAFEEQREWDSPRAVSALARDLDLPLGAAAVEECLPEVDERTRRAAGAGVTGVPTFMLDAWPFGGIQDEPTMLRVLERWRARRSPRTGA